MILSDQPHHEETHGNSKQRCSRRDANQKGEQRDHLLLGAKTALQGDREDVHRRNR